MREWLFYQFDHFNLLMIIVMIIFVTALSKANTQKMLKEQSKELYNDFEEIKDELREHHANITALINSKYSK